MSAARLRPCTASYSKMPSGRRSYSHGPSHTGLGNKTLLRTQRFMQAKTCIFSFLWSSGRRMIPQRIVPARYGDTRGWFTESYNKRVLTALGIELGRAHVCTPVTNAQLVCRLQLEKTKQ